MKKKILIGSMLVLTLLLLMPSIPAIQQKTIEESATQELQDILDEIDLDGLKDIKVLERIKHPILYYIVILIWHIKLLRYSNHLVMWGKTFEVDNWGGIYPIYPILYLFGFFRFVFLFYQNIAWIGRWGNISETLGWGWFEDW